MPELLPAYTRDRIKQQLLAAGVSGTVYALVMPESEAALAHVIDGGAPGDAEARVRDFLGMYREAWTHKQIAVHEQYFDLWFGWAQPVVDVDRAEFPFCYPTAGASEGIFKIMAEYARESPFDNRARIIHMFDGDYEGFPAYARALEMQIVRHRRQDWQQVPQAIGANDMFWISQPSAIDGSVWGQFEAFVELMYEQRPTVRVIPDLTFVGNVADDYHIGLNVPNIPAFVFSHSKPFGGHFHRVGGVVSRTEMASLVGNRGFNNLLSLSWASEMMQRHHVLELASRYRGVQMTAASMASRQLNVPGLAAADVGLLATAPVPAEPGDAVRTVLRGSGDERVVRLCLTPAMTCLIAPDMAPLTYPIFNETLS